MKKTRSPAPSSSAGFGRNDLMAVAAVRYCLGRMTYIVSECADWLIEAWPNLSEGSRSIIRRDIESEFDRDDRARASRNDFKPLGMDCDRRDWERVRTLWSGAPMPDPCARPDASIALADAVSALHLIAVGPGADGTWSRDREDCRQLAMAALARLHPQADAASLSVPTTQEVAP